MGETVMVGTIDKKWIAITGIVTIVLAFTILTLYPFEFTISLKDGQVLAKYSNNTLKVYSGRYLAYASTPSVECYYGGGYHRVNLQRSPKPKFSTLFYVYEDGLHYVRQDVYYSRGNLSRIFRLDDYSIKEIYVWSPDDPEDRCRLRLKYLDLDKGKKEVYLDAGRKHNKTITEMDFGMGIMWAADYDKTTRVERFDNGGIHVLTKPVTGEFEYDPEIIIELVEEDFIKVLDVEVGVGHASTTYEICNPTKSIYKLKDTLSTSVASTNREITSMSLKYLKTTEVEYTEEILIGYNEVCDKINHSCVNESIFKTVKLKKNVTSWVPLDKEAFVEDCITMKKEATFKPQLGTIEINAVTNYLEYEKTWWNSSYTYKRAVYGNYIAGANKTVILVNDSAVHLGDTAQYIYCDFSDAMDETWKIIGYLYYEDENEYACVNASENEELAMDVAEGINETDYLNPWDADTVLVQHLNANNTVGSSIYGHIVTEAVSSFVFNATDGKIGKSLQFDGAVEGRIAHDPSLDITEITILAWVKMTTVSGYISFVSKGATPYNFNFNLRNYNGNLQFQHHNGAWITLTSAQSITANTWYHVGVTYSSTYDTGNVAFFVNGNGEATQNSAADLGPCSNNVILGYDTQTRYKGMMDDMMIFNRTLSLKEIQFIYNNTQGSHNMTELGPETVDTDTTPPDFVTGYPYLRSFRNHTNEDLILSVKADDTDGVFGCDISWYMNNSNQTAIYLYNQTVVDNTETNFTLMSGNTSADDTWYAHVTCRDSVPNEASANSTFVTVKSKAPEYVSTYPSLYSNNSVGSDYNYSMDDLTLTLKVWDDYDTSVGCDISWILNGINQTGPLNSSLQDAEDAYACVGSFLGIRPCTRAVDEDEATDARADGGVGTSSFVYENFTIPANVLAANWSHKIGFDSDTYNPMINISCWSSGTDGWHLIASYNFDTKPAGDKANVTLPTGCINGSVLEIKTNMTNSDPDDPEYIYYYEGAVYWGIQKTSNWDFYLYNQSITNNTETNFTLSYTNTSIGDTWKATVNCRDGNSLENESDSTSVPIEADNDGPICRLVSKNIDVEENSTGDYESLFECIDPSGFNTTKSGDHYPIFTTRTIDSNFSVPNYWSVYPPENNLTTLGFNFNIWRAMGRNENYWYEYIDVFNDTHTYAVDDGDYGYMTISNTSTNLTINFSGPIESLIFRTHIYLNQGSITREDKKNYSIYKTHPLLIQNWNQAETRGKNNFTECFFRNLGYTGVPQKPLNIYFCNSSYSITGGLAPSSDSDNCVFVNAMIRADIDNIYFTVRNSSYSRSCISTTTGTIGNIVVTNITYTYYRTEAPEIKAYYFRYVNGSSGTNVSFAESNVSWTSIDSGVTWTQCDGSTCGTPDLQINTIADADVSQIGIYVPDALNNIYSNFTLILDDIGDANFPITRPTLIHYHYSNGSPDEHNNGTHRANITIHVGMAIDPDANGTVNHSLYLYHDNSSLHSIINISFYKWDDTDVNITFDLSTITDGRYKINITAVADDNGMDVKSVMSDENFTVNKTGTILQLLMNGQATDRIYEIGFVTNITLQLLDLTGINIADKVCIDMNTTEYNGILCGKSPLEWAWKAIQTVWKFRSGLTGSNGTAIDWNVTDYSGDQYLLNAQHMVDGNWDTHADVISDQIFPNSTGYTNYAILPSLVTNLSSTDRGTMSAHDNTNLKIGYEGEYLWVNFSVPADDFGYGGMDSNNTHLFVYVGARLRIYTNNGTATYNFVPKDSDGDAVTHITGVYQDGSNIYILDDAFTVETVYNYTMSGAYIANYSVLVDVAGTLRGLEWNETYFVIVNTVHNPPYLYRNLRFYNTTFDYLHNKSFTGLQTSGPWQAPINIYYDGTFYYMIDPISNDWEVKKYDKNLTYTGTEFDIRDYSLGIAGNDTRIWIHTPEDDNVIHMYRKTYSTGEYAYIEVLSNISGTGSGIPGLDYHSWNTVFTTGPGASGAMHVYNDSASEWIEVGTFGASETKNFTYNFGQEKGIITVLKEVSRFMINVTGGEVNIDFVELNSSTFISYIVVNYTTPNTATGLNYTMKYNISIDASVVGTDGNLYCLNYSKPGYSIIWANVLDSINGSERNISINVPGECWDGYDYALFLIPHNKEILFYEGFANWTVALDYAYVGSFNVTEETTIYFGGGTHMDEVQNATLNLTGTYNTTTKEWPTDIYIDIQADGTDEYCIRGTLDGDTATINETHEANTTLNISLSPILLYINVSTGGNTSHANMTVSSPIISSDVYEDAVSNRYVEVTTPAFIKNPEYAYDGDIATYALVGSETSTGDGTSFRPTLWIYENFTMSPGSVSINTTATHTCDFAGVGEASYHLEYYNESSDVWTTIYCEEYGGVDRCTDGIDRLETLDNPMHFYQKGLLEMRLKVEGYFGGGPGTADKGYCKAYEISTQFDGYPDLLIDIMNDGQYEIDTNSMNTSTNFEMNFSAIQNYVTDDSNCPGLTCLIPVLISSNFGGNLTIDKIELNQTFRNIDLNISVIQSYTESKLDIPVKIKALNGLYGTLRLWGMNITFKGFGTINVSGSYNGSGTYNATNTEQRIDTYYSNYSANLPYTWTDAIFFSPTTNNSKNVTPWGQNYITPILDITGLAYDRGFQLGIKVNETPSCWNITASNDTSVCNGTVLTTGYFTIMNLTKAGNGGIRLWLDLFDCNYSVAPLLDPHRFLRSYCWGCYPIW